LAGITEQSTLYAMKIFISLKVPRADKERRLIADLLVATVKSAGHQPFLATDEIARAGLTAPQDFMPFVRQHLANSDLFIIIYHPELRGGLIEAGIAYERHIPIWLYHKPNEKVSSSMLGCADKVVIYRDVGDLKAKIQV
jgi:hypothetical protein